MILSIDTEDTGLDLFHSARPFFVTTCNEEGEQQWWEWDVDPITRKPQIPKEDIDELRSIIGHHTVSSTGVGNKQRLVGQNLKFDAKALETIGVVEVGAWPWTASEDTLIAGHLLASNQPHNLTDMVMHYLGVDIEPLEKALEKATKAAQRLARKHYPKWQIVREGLPGVPSARSSSSKPNSRLWHYDTWLPRAIALDNPHNEYPLDHPWHTVLAEYANADSFWTMALWNVMEQELKRRGLWEICQARMKAIPVACRIESNGVTLSGERLEELVKEYRAESDSAGEVCIGIAEGLGSDISLPKSGANKSLSSFMLGPLGLKVMGVTKKGGNPSFDKTTLALYEATLPPNSKQLAFIKALLRKRWYDTQITYLEGYRRFWLPLGVFNDKGEQLWYCLHPSLNPTGTATLRWSSAHPCSQNISKQDPDWRGEGSKSLRYCFGPLPDREWWSLDFKNVELRIPAYEANEPEMVALFERPDDPPYFGSNHLLIAHILHSKLFEECRTSSNGQAAEPTLIDGRVFKKKYASTWYQWVKNGDFAVTYGAMAESGTADRAYHLQGAQRRIEARFTRIKALNDKQIAYAVKYGYVETLPDRTVNSKHGYPLLCTRTDWGRILPTVPLNYHVSGTAMWLTMRAMVRCQDQLDKWKRDDGFDGRIVLQVHDELCFDLPKSKYPPKADIPLLSNLWRVRVLQSLMAQGGDDLIPAIPTPVSATYHPNNWMEGEDF